MVMSLYWDVRLTLWRGERAQFLSLVCSLRSSPGRVDRPNWAGQEKATEESEVQGNFLEDLTKYEESWTLGCAEVCWLASSERSVREA